MNKTELLALLESYPDDMEVKVVCDRFVRPIERVSTVVDMDTNIVSIEIVAEDRKPMAVDDLRATFDYK